MFSLVVAEVVALLVSDTFPTAVGAATVGLDIPLCCG